MPHEPEHPSDGPGRANEPRLTDRVFLLAQVVIAITLILAVPLAVFAYNRGLLGTSPVAERTAPPPTGIPVVARAQVPPIACPGSVLTALPIADAGLAEDCTLLMSAASVLGGDRSPNWSTDIPITDWSGVVLGGNPLRVTALDLTTQGLNGQIPPEFGGLSGLQALHLYGNDLSGPIPPELGHLSNLSVLDLGDNRLSGPIPPELGHLSNLTSLDVGFNNLTGDLPMEMAELRGLRWLVISGNGLTGEITPLLTRLTGLTYLSLYETQLTGCIPQALQEVDGFLGELPLCPDG